MFVFFVFIWFYKASNSATYSVITVNTICFMTIFPFSFCSLCMFIFVCSVYLNWVCWVRGNFSGEPGHVYIPCVCVSAVWSAVPVQFYLGTSVGADGGTVRIFFFLWLCCSGYGTV